MTTPPDLSPTEPARLESLRRLNLVDTPLEERFERITRLARALIGVDIAAISLVEADRQFFKSIQGLDVCGTSRDVSFCGHTILGEDLHVIEDAREDARFSANPLVTGPPHIVAYAGLPLRTADGSPVGTLCAIHTSKCRFSAAQLQHLRDLACLAEVELRATAVGGHQTRDIPVSSIVDRQSCIDSLTRTWNTEGIAQFVREAAAHPHGEVVTIRVCDAQSIIQEHGSGTWCVVLRTLAKRLLSAIPETHVLGRTGDDTFICVSKDSSKSLAGAQLTARIQERLAESPLRTPVGDLQATVDLLTQSASAYELHSLAQAG